MHVLLKTGFLLLLLSVMGLSGCGTSDAKYEVKVITGENGRASISTKIVTDGDSVGFRIIPDAGYVVEEIIVQREINGGYKQVETNSILENPAGNYYSIEFVGTSYLINITFIEAGRELGVDSQTLFEQNSGSTNLTFNVSLASAASTTISVDYTTVDGTATAGVDYLATSGTLNFAPGETSKTIQVVINGDTLPEGNETFTLALSNVTGRGALGTNRTAVGLILNDDYDVITLNLNDTGMTYGANYPNGNNTGCTGETIAQQDCSSGRDASVNDDTDGHAGFSYRKVDDFGSLLSASAANWSCVQDQVTGLIWEVKQAVDSGLHDKSDTLAWYNTDPSTNGGDAGDSKTATNDCYGYNVSVPATACNTQAFVARVNAEQLCGMSNWRMPTRMELLGLVDLNRPQGVAYSASIDEDYFPNTINNAYWTSSRVMSPNGLGVVYIKFSVGTSWSRSILGSNHVRLVSDGPLPVVGGGGTDL